MISTIFHDARAFFASVVLGAMMGAISVAPAASQESGETTLSDGELIGNWLLTCEEGPCRAFINLQQQDEITIVWTMIKDPNTGEGTSLIRVPTGVALPPGLRVYATDDTFFDVPFQVCEPTGCTAILQMKDRFMKAMAERDIARVAFYRYGAPAPLAYEVPIAQMAEALEGI